MSKRLREMRLSRIRAARAEPAAAPPDPIEKFTEKAHDLDAARKSVEDAASASGGLWLSYLFALFYIGIAAGAVTHKDLLLENPVKLPFLGVELPLVAFFALAPILFVISHAYTLMHFVLLAAKVGTFNAELGKKIPDPDAAPTHDLSPERALVLRETRLGLRRQLPSNIFVQFLAGPSDIRGRGLGSFLRAIAWISLVIGPVLLLLLLQIQFLPYHLAWVTWVQRFALLADVTLLWFLWPAVLASRGSIRRPQLRRHPVLALLSLVSISVAFSAATFPGEWLDEHVGNRQLIPPNAITAWLGATDQFENPRATSFHNLLFTGQVDSVTRRRKSPFSNTIVLPGFDALAAAKIDDQKKLDGNGIKHSLILRGRHLEGAVFNGADLRKVDLEGVQLQGASLNGAQLQGASLKVARLQGALLYSTKLQGASLYRAELEGAALVEARLEGAALDRAKLQGSDLRDSTLSGVDMQFDYVWRTNFEDAHLDKIVKGGMSEDTLSKEDFATLKDKIIDLVPGGVLRAAALKRIEILNPDVLGPETSNQALLEHASVDWNAYQTALAANLKNLVCSIDLAAPFILRGLMANDRLSASGVQAAALVEAIVKPKAASDCFVSAALTDDDKAALNDIAIKATAP